MEFMEIPLASRRQKIGLLGGSFDPAHEATYTLVNTR